MMVDRASLKIESNVFLNKNSINDKQQKTPSIINIIAHAVMLLKCHHKLDQKTKTVSSQPTIPDAATNSVNRYD